MQNIDRFVQVMQRLRKLRLSEIPKINQDLSIAQMTILKKIIGIPGARLQQIADAVGVTPPSMSVALKKLEEGKWVTRNQDPADKRASCFSPTSKTKELFLSVMNFQKQGLTDFLSGLEDEEQNQLISLMEKAINYLEAEK